MRLLVWHIKLGKQKALRKCFDQCVNKKISKKLMSIAWVLKRW